MSDMEAEQAELIRRLSEANGKLRGQRDALLEACKAALGEIENGPCDVETCPHTDCATAKLRAAIAKVEED